jgi:glycosyltransferase involved in cell wall biosynthesis
MNRGGIETLLMNLYRNIDKSIVQFDFLVHTEKTGDFDDEIKRMGGLIYSIPPRNKGVLKNYKALKNFFIEHKEYKIVHQHISSLSYVTPLKIASKQKIPLRIIHAHNTKQGGKFIHRIIHSYNKLSLSSYANMFWACSIAAAEWFYTPQIISGNYFKLVNNAIDTEKFTFNLKTRINKRMELNLSDKFIVGHVGRFSNQKNHLYLVEIFKSLSEENPNAHLLLVGDGYLRNDIESKIEEYNLLNKVSMLGVRKDIPELLQAMDVFVMPSYHEGLPVTLIEAQASNLPCIISDTITSEVQINDNVIKCKLDADVIQWVELIKQSNLLSKRSNKRENIINNGYDIENVSKDVLRSYVKVLEEMS